ncbi:hypothetical protein MKW98_023844 [Papaver atlanticum]|uniref:Uncharacterized protein n=1 Tax=Papaver atlanticum TaxID=357466 RepID=A0AAD4SXC0_9MAGN|nr:hypothetical protein MKW98_023844 [Papaver atlanticum]
MFRMMMVMKSCSKEYRFLNPITTILFNTTTTNTTTRKLPKSKINFSTSLNPNCNSSLEISHNFSKANKLDENNKEIIIHDIDASSSIRKPLGSTLWPGTYPSPVTNALWTARSSSLTAVGATTEEEPMRKTPSQGRTSIIYNFSSDYILREQYRDPSIVGVRFGKLLEEMPLLVPSLSR